MAKTSGGVRGKRRERTKSIQELTEQRYRIQRQAYNQYGSSDRQRAIRDRVKATFERYFANSSKAYNDMIPNNIRVNRSTYMGLNRR